HDVLHADGDRRRPVEALARSDNLAGCDGLAVAVYGPEFHGFPLTGPPGVRHRMVVESRMPASACPRAVAAACPDVSGSRRAVVAATRRGARRRAWIRPIRLRSWR